MTACLGSGRTEATFAKEVLSFDWLGLAVSTPFGILQMLRCVISDSTKIWHPILTVDEEPAQLLHPCTRQKNKLMWEFLQLGYEGPNHLMKPYVCSNLSRCFGKCISHAPVHLI